MNDLKRLQDLEFKKIGYWEKHTLYEDRIEFIIDENYNSCSDLLYVYEADEKICYIGKTDVSIKSRLSNYKAGKKGGSAGSTNQFVHEKILNLLKKNSRVNIYVLIKKLDFKFHGIEISLASGIEMNLIKEFEINGLWNSRGTKNQNKSKITNSTSKISNNINNCFKFKLKEYYYNSGIISFGKKYDKFLSNKGGIPVKLIIQDDSNIIYPTFTLSGENRKINGKTELIEWFQKNFNINDEVNIEIISETEFKIYK